MNQPLSTDATRQHWDELAATYDALKDRNDVYYAGLKACFHRAVPPHLRRSVLEVGCGTGQILASLQPAHGVGIDLSENMIAAARQRYADRPELRFEAIDAVQARALVGGETGRGDGGNEGGPFDAVISADVMEHVPDWRAVVDAMLAACRPGGVLVISTPNPLWTFPLWALEKLRLKMPEGPHRFVWRQTIAAHLRQRGATVLEVSTHLMAPARLGGLGPALSHVAGRLPLLRNCGVIQLIVASNSTR